MNGATPSGTFVSPVIALLTFALIASINFSFGVPFKTVMPFGSGFGNTVTGTFTVSSPVGYVTVVGTVISVTPALPVVSGRSVAFGSFTFPPVPGVTASFTLAASGLFPSTV